MVHSRRQPLPHLALGLVLLVAATACAGASQHDEPATAPDAPAATPTPWEPPPTDRPLQAGFLVVDGVYNSELMAPYDIFQHTIFHTEPGIETFVVSPDGEPIVTFEGLTITPHHSFETAPPIDILVVPSAEHSMDTDLDDETMIQWVRKVGGEARLVLSLCDGAFVLAQAGLLDGQAATTFPSDVDAFAQRFPEVDVKINVSFVHDGRMITSQGGAKSYDPAMYMVDLLYGPKVAQGVGRGLIIPWPPQAGEIPSFIADPEIQRLRQIRRDEVEGHVPPTTTEDAPRAEEPPL